LVHFFITLTRLHARFSSPNSNLDKVIKSMKCLDGNYYHIYNRGAHKQPIFFEDENYFHLVNLFIKYFSQYRITIAAYCLMPNHYHLILKQNETGSIGSFLKTTFNAYTQAVNTRFGLSGTLFQGQAKIKHIDTDSYCLQVIRYIHLNPVVAGLVTLPEEWEFSNYREWIGTRRGLLIDHELKTGYFKNGEQYNFFVNEYVETRDKKNVAKFLFDED